MIDLPRSTYYYRSKALSLSDSQIVAIIEDIQEELPCYGYRGVAHELQRRGHLVNTDRLFVDLNGISDIMASMDMIDVMQRQFVAAAPNDLLARIACGEIDSEQKRKKLLSIIAEELFAGVYRFG